MVLDLIFLLGIATISAGLGLRILRCPGETPDVPADAWALALPLGLGTLSLGAFALGEIGCLTPGAIAGWLAIAGTIGGTDLVASSRRLVSSSRSARWSWAWDGPLAIALVGTFLTAMAPVTDGDALCYHLQVPKVFLASGSLGFDPDLHETVYPLLTELLYAIALALRGPVACRLVQWLLGIVFAMNVAALARPVLGDRARWAATVALLVPAVSNGMGAPLNDVALAALGNAALHAWSRWTDRSTVRTAALAGVLAGLAMGAKYPAIVLTCLVAMTMVASGIVHRRSLRPALVFIAVAIFVGGGWYARTYAYTGNPVFPFFRHVFGGSGLDEVLDPIKRPMATTPWRLATAIVPMTLQPSRFDSVSHQFGPLFLLVLPALFWERAPRRVWALVGIGYAFLTLCLTQRQSMRFVLIAAGPMAVGVAWLAARWSERRSLPTRAIAGLFVFCLLFEAMIAAGRARHGLMVVLGRETADTYLSRREPTYRVGRWIDRVLPKSARLVGQEHRGFYIPRGYTMELAHRRRTGLGLRGESADEIVAALRNGGYTHLLLCPPEPEDAVEFDPTLSRRLAPWLDGKEPHYRERIVDPDGVARRYAIYALGDTTVPVASKGGETRR